MPPFKDPTIEIAPPRVEKIVVAILGIAVAIYFGGLATPLTRMFLLIEYRHWTYDPQLAAFLDFFDPAKIMNSYAYTISGSRSFSLFAATVLGKTCEYNSSCHNAIHLLLVVCCAAAAALTVRSLTPRSGWLPALVTATFFLLSIPVFDALQWQATLLDKLASLFSALALLVASRTTLDDRSVLHTIRHNVGLLLLVMIAYNAKEAAFFLLPAVLGLVFIRASVAGLGTAASIRKTLQLTVAPTLYVAFHVSLVFINRVFLVPGEFQRVTGGNVGFNIEYYTRYLLNMMGAVTPLQLGLSVLAILVVGAATALKARRIPGAIGWLILWSIAGFAGSFVIPLRTSATAPFYLLVPLLYLSMLSGFIVGGWIASAATATGRSISVALGMALICLHVWNFRSNIPGFQLSEKLSTNFARTLDAVKQERERHHPRRIIFVRPAELQRAYMFVSSPGDAGPHALGQYLVSPSAPFSEVSAVDNSIVDVPFSARSDPLHTGDLRISLNDSLAIAGIERGPQP
jgi:hypothetical protein